MNAPAPIPAFFAAMQAGRSHADAMMALFEDDAVYVEPFTGTVRTHHGLAAIRRALEAGWEQPLPDVRIAVDRVDIDGDVVTALWTCFSPALPGGRSSGVNTFHLRDGRIARLETSLG